MLAWLLLAGAIASEVVATSALKLSNGFSRPGWTLVVVAGYVAAFAMLGWALKLKMPVGVAYAVWSGIGTAAIAAIGTLFLGETMNLLKALDITLIIGGVVILNVAGTH
ncbi:DMT family transporter [Thermobispora bispora]|uniref:DMT family transporter n=1 Tax=Thermobispora bispora TaxID=2006 RepID=UPI00197CFDFD|nr:multidrug efflux SMR transporter [Thermobispora bispora]QSI48283.1 multidrug efflux SMR transporter [Thermobispora bispora]